MAEAAHETTHNFFQIQGHEFGIAPHTLGDVFGFPITTTVTTALLDLVVILALLWWVRSFSVRNPTKSQLFVESIVLALRNFLEGIIGNAKLAREIVPIVAAVVVFLVLSNLLMVIIPFLPAIKWGGEHLFRVHTSDLNATLGMAVSLMLVVQVYAVYKIGLINHISKYIQIPQVINGFKKGIGQGFGALGFFLLGLLELVSELARIASLGLRLFGNIFAGEILLLVALGGFAALLPVPILILALAVGVIQALVFGALLAAKFAEAAEKPHH